MLAYAIPGYILVKCKAVKETSIPAFAKVLLYVLQPCLSIYSFQKVTYSPALARNMLVFLGLCTALQVGMLLLMRLALAKRYNEDVRRKVATGATVMGNVGFFGIPLLEALLPDYPEAIAYAAIFVVSFNLIAWTLGAYLLTGDKKYLLRKEVVLNPPFLTLFITLPLFFTSTTLPPIMLNSITILGKFTTPMCMLILGMRFATADVKDLFASPSVYLSTAIKLVVFPLLAFLVTHWLPIEYSMKATLYILCCCPTASMVQSLCELSDNGGQKYAAYSLIMSAMFCIVTIPLLLLLL